MKRSLALFAVVLGVFLGSGASLHAADDPQRIAVIPAIPGAAGGTRVPAAQTSAAAYTLSHALAQVRGVVISSASGVYHAAAAAGGAGGTTPEAAAKAARTVEASIGILVDVTKADGKAQLTATFVAPEGTKTRVPSAVVRQGTLALETDFFNVQNEFVQAVLAALKLKPNDEEAKRIAHITRATSSAKALDMFALAQQHIPVASMEAYDYAARVLAEAIKADGKFALAHASLSEVTSLLSTLQALSGLRDDTLKAIALRAGRRAVELRPEIPETHRALALAYTLGSRDHLMRAAQSAQKAIEMRGDDPQSQLWMGVAAGAQGKTHIERALALDPSLALGHFFRAILAYQEGDQKLMATECGRAVQFSPLDPSPLLLIGEIQSAEGKLDEAIATFQQVLRTLPRTAIAHGSLGRLYARKGQTDKARDALRQAFVLDGRVVEMMRQRAIGFQQQAQLEEAEKEYRLILMGDEKDTPSWRGLGKIALDRGKTSDAEGHFRKALTIASKDAWAYIGLAKVHQRMGKPDEALQDLRAAVEAQPDEPYAHFELGLAYEQRNRLKEAAEAYDQAVLKSQLFHDAHYRRASVYDKLQDPKVVDAWKQYLRSIQTAGGPRTATEKDRVAEATAKLRALTP